MVAAGVVLLVIGLVLSFVPLVNQGSTQLGQYVEDAAGPSGYSITGSIPMSISWTSSNSGELAVGVSSCSVSQVQASSCSASTTWHNQSGTSGSESFSVPDGGSVTFVFSAAGGGSITLTTALTTIGLIVIVLGILVLIAGLVLKRKQPKAPPMAPVTSNPPPSQP